MPLYKIKEEIKDYQGRCYSKSCNYMEVDATTETIVCTFGHRLKFLLIPDDKTNNIILCAECCIKLGLGYWEYMK